MELFLLMILILILSITVMMLRSHRKVTDNLPTEDKAKLIAYMIRHENDD